MSTRRDAGELIAATATAVIHVLPLERWAPEVLEIVVLMAGWTTYLGVLIVTDRKRLSEMGFRREGLWGSARATALVAIVSTVVMAAYAHRAGTLELHPHMLVLLVLYPFWGLVQQWLVQGIIARQLAPRMPRWSAVLATAIVFGALHLPQLELAAATFALGLALTPIYLRWRNVWILGVAHGWLAVPMYFWVLGIDPWAAVTTS